VSVVLGLGPNPAGSNGETVQSSLAEDKRCNLPHGFFLDAGIAVLRECTAWVSGNRMSKLESATRLVVGRDEREQICRAGRRTKSTVVIALPDDQGRKGDARSIEVEGRLTGRRH
jgi:hypothetical protein